MNRIPGTVTGRWASSQPFPVREQMPREPARDMHNKALLDVDYAAVEARIIARLTGDERIFIYGNTLATASQNEAKQIREQMERLASLMTEHTGQPWGWLSLADRDAQVLAPLE